MARCACHAPGLTAERQHPGGEHLTVACRDVYGVHCSVEGKQATNRNAKKSS